MSAILETQELTDCCKKQIIYPDPCEDCKESAKKCTLAEDGVCSGCGA